jgi:hypothetical protein
VLSGTSRCYELITRPEEYYRLWCVVVCDLENSWKRRPYPALAAAQNKNKKLMILRTVDTIIFARTCSYGTCKLTLVRSFEPKRIGQKIISVAYK